jgi:hypothetical protein
MFPSLPKPCSARPTVRDTPRVTPRVTSGLTARCLAIAALAWSAAWPLAARASEPTADSVQQLLAVTKTEALMDQMYGHFEQAMRAGMQQAMAGKRLTAQQQAIVDAAPAEFAAVMREEFSWAKLQPLYVGIYRESFTQDEIDGMLAFYATPAGRAVIDKMPQVMARSMQLMQVMAAPVTEKMRAAMQRAIEKAQSAG